jgi:DNA-binding LacI/PurR family transcriptional regulator
VAGFDDIDFAAYANPALTTLNVPSQEMGRLAGQALIELVKNGNGKRHQHTLETTLIIRESCAPPAI